MKQFLLPLLVFFICFSHQAQQLSNSEKEMVEFLREHEEEQINFLEKTVNVNSGTLNPEGVREAGMLYKEELDKLGFDT